MDRFRNWKTREFVIFAAVAAVVFGVLTFFRNSLPQITNVLLIIELGLLISITWGLAAHAVLKSLFAVSVELSLILFIADEYCKVPLAHQTADSALMTLVGVGMIYIGIKFFWTVYEEAKNRVHKLREVDRKQSWLILVPYALFTGLFSWQVISVVLPIVNNLCVYQPH